MQANIQRMYTPTKQEQSSVQVIPEIDMRDSNQEIPMSQSSIAEEYCPISGDLYVAWDKKNQKMVCN
jgi:hypothetical protein